MKVTIPSVPEKEIDILGCEQCPDHSCYIDSDGCADCSCGLSTFVEGVYRHGQIPKGCPRLKIRGVSIE